MTFVLKTAFCAVLLWVVNALTLILFFCHAENPGVKTIFFFISALFVYALLYTLPAIAAGVFSCFLCCRKSEKQRLLLPVCATLTAGFITTILLLFDLGLYHGWGFHFNPLVYNLLTTPGGFSSMGLRFSHIASLLVIILAIALAFAGAALAVIKFKFAERYAKKIFSLSGSLTLVLLLALSTSVSMLFYGYERYKMNPEVLNSAQVIPLYAPVSMRSFMRSLGVAAPSGNELLFKSKKGKNHLSYPLKEIVRNSSRKKYNIVWLACESWRSDMLTKEIMPNAWSFAEESVRFTDNHSGGNGTRMGIFTMFYSLYGNYWHIVLNMRRGPLFIDWLIEDNYKFYCVTSAKFTYPEFEHTIWEKLPRTSLESDDNGKTYERDQRNVRKLCDFIRNSDKNTPFMAFMFFESPHAPYEFPPEAEIHKDYQRSINYATASAENGPGIKKRYINSCRHLDMRLKEVFDTLKEKNLYDSTIVVLAGDHGEEFFEKGRLGHNSAFHKEQIHTPLVIRIPGKKPQVYSKMSSHLDIVPMLAPYFGVTNPPEDYSLGYNLLDGKSERKYSISCGWSELFYTGAKHKILLPTDPVSFATGKLYNTNDEVVSGKDDFFRSNASTLMKIQINSSKFNN